MGSYRKERFRYKVWEWVLKHSRVLRRILELEPTDATTMPMGRFGARSWSMNVGYNFTAGSGG
jgi:hypothetical protein